MDFFQAYGRLAKVVERPILISGRHVFHESLTQAIVGDVASKMRLQASNTLLEIGCGSGLLLRPLADRVAMAVGIDHPACLERFRALGIPGNVRLIGGRWPEVAGGGQFDRILVYSVVHCLQDRSAARAFIDACWMALEPGGVLLLGDLPNEDSARRFRHSSVAAEIDGAYQRKKEACDDSASVEQRAILGEAGRGGPFIDDAFLMSLMTEIRRHGLEAYLLPQPPDLPFSASREDLLVWRRP